MPVARSFRFWRFSPWSATAAVTVVDFRLPGQPTLTASIISDSAIRYTSTARAPSAICRLQYFGLQCSTRMAARTPPYGRQRHAAGGSYLSAPIASTHSSTYACQWRDGSVAWLVAVERAGQRLALALDIRHTPRAEQGDPIKNLEYLIDSYGGVFFGLSLFPFL